MMAIWLRIAAVDAMAALGGFARLHRFIRKIVPGRRSGGLSASEVCAAVDRAAVYYPRQLLCLKRSAAMTWMLRAHGHPAQLVIGACVTPFLAHAWVELDGRVINDNEPVIRGTYVVLERC
jgi:Transglutaminase-like superfamily